MRKLSLFLAFALVLTFACGAFAQTIVVSVDGTTNEYTPAQLNSGKNHEVSIRFNLLGAPDPGFWVGGSGFEIYSPDGADWGGLQGYEGPLVAVAAARGTLSTFAKHYNSPDRTIAGNWVETGNGGADPAGGYTGVNSGAAFYIATLSIFGDAGFIGGVDNGIGMLLNFSSQTADAGLSICIDTVTQGVVAWEWAAPGTQDFPVFDNGHGGDGPYCWEIFEVPNLPAEWCNAPAEDAISFNHCGQGSYQLCATDPDDATISPGPETFILAPGFDGGDFGEVTPSGAWTWSGATVPQTGTVDIEFIVNDGITNTAEHFVLHVTLENNPPAFDVCPSALATVSVGTPRTQTLVFSDPDVCDAPTISLGTVTNGDAGDVIDIVGGDVTYTPAGLARVVTMEIIVSDGDLTDVCILEWNVIEGSAYQVELDKVHDVLQGHFVDMPIILHSADAENGLGGFDLLVAYDASALSFQLALEGDLYADPYNWEYFTYRYGAYGNCGNACPSGMLRIIGLAETNNGVATAECVYDATAKPVLAYIRFLVSNDRTLECQYVPVRFFWYDCTDNILSSCDGGTAYLSAKVYDYVDSDFPFQDGEMSDGTVGFPTFQGTQDDCLFSQGDKLAKADVDFQNGGIDIICADSIDARGDINLNGLAYEIADAVMFTNYFINGLAAFGTHIEGSIAASDVNADGIALSVADLVYLIRVVIGDAAPYAKSAPVAANVTFGNDRFNVDIEMGAAHIVMEGNVVPTLLADNMEMLYASNGQTTSILVYSTVANQSFRGDFLQVSGDVVSTEFATFTGARVAAKVMPTDFVVEQNYPNPFNPSTTFKFTVPNGGDWTLGVYNITGQLVESFSGVSETGYESVVWDASNFSSGIYFYRVSTEAQSVTKKAVLLK